jgi:F-type H+-transporting ATPase subunit epsilon
MTQMHCVVVTPEATALEQAVDFVALPLEDGEIGIARDHSPLIGRLGFGEMRLRVGGDVQRFYVDGGFAQVVENRVTVLTNRAVPADEIDDAAIAEQLQAALQQPANTPQLLAVRDRLLSQARGQLLVARRSSR